jgi:hypothetical protein
MRKDAIYIDTPRPRRRPMVKRSRAIPVVGQPIEAYQYERLIKCWYCGDDNTTGRDEGKSSNSRMSSTYSMPVQVSLGIKGYKAEESISVNRSIFTTRVAPKAGADGTARAIKNLWTVTAHIGCKACGTLLED